MKVTLTNGLEIECTPEEYEILCNKGLIPGVGSDKKTTITINENDPWDVIIKPKDNNEKTNPYDMNEKTNPYDIKEPWPGSVVMLYGCQIPNDSIRYLDTAPTAGTEANSITPEQFMKLKSIVGDNSNDKPGDNTVRV